MAKPDDDDELPPKQPVPKRGKSAHSSLTMSREIREAILASLHYTGGPTRFFVWLQKHRPDTFAACAMKALVREDDAGLGGLNIVVQRITIGADAQPIAGVITSPVAQHIPRLVAAGGQIVGDVDGSST